MNRLDTIRNGMRVSLAVDHCSDNEIDMFIDTFNKAVHKLAGEILEKYLRGMEKQYVDTETKSL